MCVDRDLEIILVADDVCSVIARVFTVTWRLLIAGGDVCSDSE